MDGQNLRPGGQRYDNKPKFPMTVASAGIGPSAQRSPMPAWKAAKAGDVAKGFSSPSVTATCTKVTPSSRRKVTYREPLGLPRRELREDISDEPCVLVGTLGLRAVSDDLR